MRKLVTIIVASLAACACMAGVKDVPIYLAMGDATALTGTVENVSGYVEAVYVSCETGTATGVVAIAIVPKDDQTTAIDIATGTAIGSKVWRPAIDRTAVAGTDLSSDPPGRFVMVNDTLRFIVSVGDTGVTWRATVIIEDK